MDKHDADKERLDLISPYAELALGAVLTHGARKYGDRNWEQGDWETDSGRILAAAMRHINAIRRGEDIDGDSGLPHVDHALCNLHFLSHYWHIRKGEDNNE